VIPEKFWLTGILHRSIKCSDPVKSAPGKGISMTRTPILFIPLVIVLTTFIRAPASAWAATGVRFGVDQNLSGPAEASDPEIREVGLAASPSNPSTVVAVFSDDFPRSRDVNCRWMSSADSGRTWVPGGVTQLILNGSQCFDESVVADASDTFFFAYLEVLLKNRNSRQNILVARSVDGGRSFPAFSIVASSTSSFFVDKPLLAADVGVSSPFRGTLYLSYSVLGATDTRIVVVVSRDGGVTWTGPATVSRVAPFPSDEVQGSLPLVASDGTVYVLYADYRLNTGPLAIKIIASKDGGRSWSAPADVAAGLPSPGAHYYLRNGDPGFGSTPYAGLVGNSFPTAAVAPDGTLTVAWTDFPNGFCVNVGGSIACTNADVRVSVLKSGGKTWTAPTKVSDETNATDQFLPWLAAHPNGTVSVIWLDRRLDAGNVNYNAFYTNTSDGSTFLPNVQVSSATSLVGTASKIGEYPGLAVTPDGLIAAWPDLRDPIGHQVFIAKGFFLP